MFLEEEVAEVKKKDLQSLDYYMLQLKEKGNFFRVSKTFKKVIESTF